MPLQSIKNTRCFRLVMQSSMRAPLRNCIIFATKAESAESGSGPGHSNLLSYGLIVSKKVSKRAVDRNKIKRRLRHILRSYGKSDILLPFKDIVVVARHRAVACSFEELKQEIGYGVRKLNKKPIQQKSS